MKTWGSLLTRMLRVDSDKILALRLIVGEAGPLSIWFEPRAESHWRGVA